MRYPLLLTVICVVATGCASTKFTPFSDGGAVRHGAGGAKEVVKGIDIWRMGTPDRQYRILGLIEDTRPQAVIPMASFKGDIAAATKAHGGDAAIILSQDHNQLGTYVTGGNSYGTFQAGTLPVASSYSTTGSYSQTKSPTFAVNVSDQFTVVAVIKYVD